MADTQAGVPAQTDQDTQGSSEPSEMDKKLANLVNSAVSSHLKRSLPKALDEALTPHMSKFQEMFSQARPADPPKQSATPAAQASGTDSEVLKQLEDMKNQLKREQETRAKERAQARQDKAFADVRAELTGKVRPEAVDHVLKVLAHDRLVEVDNSGMVQMKVGDDSLPLKEGLMEYLKRKENAIFLPAPGYSAQPAKKPGLPATQRQVPQRTAPNGGQQPEREDPLQKTLRQLGMG